MLISNKIHYFRNFYKQTYNFLDESGQMFILKNNK